MFQYWSLNWALHLAVPVVMHQVALKWERKIDRTMNGPISAKKNGIEDAPQAFIPAELSWPCTDASEKYLKYL